MERRNRRSVSVVDDLSVVKAAAWAWYQHGSGSQGKVMHEFIDTTRIRQSPKPSRYKLEAIKLQTRQKESEASKKSCNNTLLDAYEVERISKQLDILIEYSRLHSQNALLSSSEGESSNELREMNTNKKKKKKKKKKQGWFWFRHGIAGCGSKREDVLNTLVLSKYDHPQSKRVEPLSYAR